MKFGAVPLAEATGAVLAHSVMADGRKMAKGRVLTADDLTRLAEAGLRAVTVARLEPGDVGEDAAAARLAAALVPDPKAACLTITVPHTGRVNLHATGPGIAAVDTAAVHALNLVDPAITLATLPPHARVSDRTLVGTVKIISYAVAGAALDAACAVARGAAAVRPVVLRSAGLILTDAPGEAAKLNDKGREAIAGRLRALGMELAEVVTVPHDRDAMAAALRGVAGEMVLILTGAATSDLHDDGPEAVRAAGGTVARFGMPVDPGNLLFHGRLGARPVIGLPGCARSPALNGADWVLERLACGLDVTDTDIAAMGVGGLLKEIPIRPQPRERKPAAG
jgi:molybdenum cofactor cytidylyltransferase